MNKKQIKGAPIAEMLDCKGLMCPLPFIKMFRAAKNLSTGQTLVVEATDPAFKVILLAWVARMNYHLVDFEDVEVQRAVLQVA